MADFQLASFCLEQAHGNRDAALRWRPPPNLQGPACFCADDASAAEAHMRSIHVHELHKLHV